MNITNIVKDLKENDEDFELYPTTKEMLYCVYDYLKTNSNNFKRHDFSILDIGAGTCNFRKYYQEYFPESKWLNYYVMEKSNLLLQMMDKDVIVLGTDFWENTLIDKKVSAVFCNPPYSEFDKWTCKILEETVATEVYMVIPSRWKENKNIQRIINDEKINYTILGNFDFHNAERAARANVDIVVFTLGYYIRNSFDHWFDKTFPEAEQIIINEAEKKEKIKHQLTTGKDKVDILCQLYNDELNTLLNHFKTINDLDDNILKSINIERRNVKEALRMKIEGLKNLYWEITFDSLESITSRLTRASREKMLSNFTIIKRVDFNMSNIYSLVIWVCKNAQSYYNDQLIKFYKDISSYENVKPYKSNTNAFLKERWRWYQENYTNYVLDYRLIVSSNVFGQKRYYRDEFEPNNSNIDDIKAIANNLGFYVENVDYADYGDVGKFYTYNNEVLMEYRVYKNGNAHIKMNKKFSKALNVEAARLLGWIRDKRDIKEEFPEDFSEDAEQYFGTNRTIDANYRNLLTM